MWTWSFTVFLEEWSQEIFHGHCCASVVRLAWKALFVFASVFINKALHHLFNIQTCPFFHPLPTFHLAELQEHAWWLWQSFIHVKITNYLLVIWFLVESAVFQGGSGRQYWWKLRKKISLLCQLWGIPSMMGLKHLYLQSVEKLWNFQIFLMVALLWPLTWPGARLASFHAVFSKLILGKVYLWLEHQFIVIQMYWASVWRILGGQDTEPNLLWLLTEMFNSSGLTGLFSSALTWTY